MSSIDMNTFRHRAETLLRQASQTDCAAERRRLIDLAAHWHACTLMGARSLMVREGARRVA
jgi:hypothetical protein